ncbi:MAG TPA: transporter substrate-binding domain-containing protein [Burkholderiaceae bacterium]
MRESRWRSWLAYLIVATAAFQLSLPADAADRVLTISKVERSGVVDDIARAVLTQAYRRLGITLEFKELPATRALVESSSGVTDGEMQRRPGLSTQYPELLQIDVPINWLDFCVFTRTAQFTPNGWESLRPYKIGFHRGILAIEEGTKGMDTDPADSNEQLLLKLQAGRTDIVVMDEADGVELVRKMKDASIRKLSPPVAHLKLYHYLNKKNASIARQLEQVLRNMERDGTIAAIHSRLAASARLPDGEK